MEWKGRTHALSILSLHPLAYLLLHTLAQALGPGGGVGGRP